MREELGVFGYELDDLLSVFSVMFVTVSGIVDMRLRLRATMGEGEPVGSSGRDLISKVML